MGTEAIFPLDLDYEFRIKFFMPSQLRPIYEEILNKPLSTMMKAKGAPFTLLSPPTPQYACINIDEKRTLLFYHMLGFDFSL